METINVNELVDLSLNLIFYFTIGSFGAFFKVLYESMTTENYKIRIGKIIIGGGTTAILCIGLNYTILKDYNIGTRFMVAALMGILGFEIFGKIKTIDGLKSFINDVIDIVRGTKCERIENPTPPQEGGNDDTGNNSTVSNEEDQVKKPPDNEGT